MKKISIAFLAGMALFTVASCGDLLNIDQHGVTSVERFYKTDEDILSAGAAMYYDLRDQYPNGIMIKCAIDDDFYAGGGGRGDNSQVEYLDEFTYDAEHGTISGYFKGLYTIIFDANIILEKVDSTLSETAAMVYNEAKVFRAYSYFELITLWGNVPYVDHVLSPEEYQIPNGSADQLWALVERDLKSAISSGKLSSKTSVDDKKTWRITKEAAQALLGKAYLWQGKNKEAAEVLDQVINSGKYSLFNEYGEMLDIANKHNCESIIEFDHPIDFNNITFNFLNGMAMWRLSKMSGVPSDLAPDGFGFYTPSKDLYNEFLTVESPDGYRLNETLRTYAQLNSQFGITLKEPHYANEGYFMWKSRLKANQIIGAVWVTTRNKILMRYGEVLLLAAEANLTENPTKATSYFNMIRERAGASTVASVNLPMIQTEKRLELCYEGCRWQDLNRWGIAADKLSQTGKSYPMLEMDGTISYRETNNPTYGFKKGKHELLPIPAEEMRVNNVIKQNPGW